MDRERLLSAVTAIAQFFKWTNSEQFEDLDALNTAIDKALSVLTYFHLDAEMIDASRYEMQYRYQNDLEQRTLNEELMNFLADPDGEPGRPRRGLIIGDVQSGKTSTYTGLICKAADAGYKVFIILTGMIESLRVQTQQRIEEGFVGVDLSTGKAIRCGELLCQG